MVEKYSASLDRLLNGCSLMHRFESSVVEMANQINKNPLYAMDESAIDRISDLFNAGELHDIASIPQNGCSVSYGDSCMALWRTDMAGLSDVSKRIQKKMGVDIPTHSSDQTVSFAFLQASKTAFLNDVTGEEMEGTLLDGGLVFRQKHADKNVSYAFSLDIAVCEIKGNKTVINVLFMPQDAGPDNGSIYKILSGFWDDGKLSLTSKAKSPRDIEDYVSTRTKLRHHSVTLALASLAFTDLPRHYVVEETPAHVSSDRKPRTKLDRYQDRERWVTMDPEEARRRMTARTDKGGSHASPVLHLRRAHDRTLKSERYTFRRGSIIRIRPTWVGDREWANGKVKYRVVSRLGAKENQA